MEEENNTSQDLFKCDQETLSSKPEEPVAGTSKSSEWPMLPATQKETSLPASTIPPGQKTPVNPVVPEEEIPWRLWERQGGQTCPLFKENAILPIPELVAETVPKTLSFIITDPEPGRANERNVWRTFQDSRDPRSVLLPAKLCHLESPVTLWGASNQTGRE